jgi:catechol 2,3-dioxygenase-like lactoylglutathione lyase family enzyme
VPLSLSRTARPGVPRPSRTGCAPYCFIISPAKDEDLEPDCKQRGLKCCNRVQERCGGTAYSDFRGPGGGIWHSAEFAAHRLSRARDPPAIHAFADALATRLFRELDMTNTELLPIDVYGMAHVNLTVSSFSAALEFYGQLLPFFGLKKVMETENFVYWVGGRTALAIQRCAPEYSRDVFVQARVGLHHLCFRAREHDDIDAAARFLKEIGAKIIRGPQAGEWAPGYYYVLFEDPDGIRLEICHIPGKGVLKEGVSFNNASRDY